MHLYFLFVKQLSKPKRVRKGIGQELRTFRRKIVHSVIVNAQRNRFKQFLSSGSVCRGHLSSMCGLGKVEDD